MYLKRLKRKTRIERLQGRLVLAASHITKMEKLSICFESALRKIRSSENWTDKGEWVGESTPLEIASKALEEADKIVGKQSNATQA